MAIVIFRRNLSENKESRDAIPGSHPITDAHYVNLSVVLLFPFMLQNQLLTLFLAKDATLPTYKEFCQKVWVKCEINLPSHFRFYAQNICQMQKTRIEIRADIDTHANA